MMHTAAVGVQEFRPNDIHWQHNEEELLFDASTSTANVPHPNNPVREIVQKKLTHRKTVPRMRGRRTNLPEPVYLQVYDLGQRYLTQTFNSLVRSYGAFHSGIEVFNSEWSFGMTFEKESTGVIENDPRAHPDHTYKETICVGYTRYSRVEVLAIVDHMMIDWPGCTYHFLTRNCHHFSEELCGRLLKTTELCLPSWLNELALTGAATLAVGYDGGEVIYDLFNTVNRTVRSAFTSGTPDRTEDDKEQPCGRDASELARTRPYNSGKSAKRSESCNT